MVESEYPPDFGEAEIEALRRSAKEALRKRCASLRRALLAPARRERSEAVCRLLRTLDELGAAGTLSTYAPLKFEIDPTSAVEQCFAEGKRLALPRVEPGTRELALHAYEPGDALIESALSVREPAPTAHLVALEDIELVLVPGLGFDQRGYRLGYGKGFYDRLLPRLPRALRVGLCYELSLLVEVPASAHDAPVDVIVTDRRVIRCQR